MFSFFFSSRRRHTRCLSDWSSDVCSSDLKLMTGVTWGRGGLPRMDYEVTLEGKKIAGDDFFCTTTFPVGDSFCSLVVRSEERRVGKECRSRWWRAHQRKKEELGIKVQNQR